jgi:protein-S-isoprenylcysteine O-methyltransferase Ste14
MLITIIATLVYLGLAILGWGGFAAFFSHPALTALAITLLVLSGLAVFSGGNLSPGVREDRANRWVIAAFGLIGLLDAHLPAYTNGKEFWIIDGDAIRWLGVVLFAAGGALRIWPVFVLGRRFSGLVAIQPGHTLVTAGLYGVVRHPGYLSLLVNSLASMRSIAAARRAWFPASIKRVAAKRAVGRQPNIAEHPLPAEAEHRPGGQCRAPRS